MVSRAVLTARRPGRLLGLVRAALGVVQLVTRPFQIAATSHWSEVFGGVVFVSFLVWVVAASVWLLSRTRQGSLAVLTPGSRAPTAS